MTFALTYDVISGLQIKFHNVFEKFVPGAIKYHFRIRLKNRFSSLVASTGAETPPKRHGPVKYRQISKFKKFFKKYAYLV